MKRFLLIILLIARAPVIAGPAVDNRPLVSGKYLSQQNFKDHGLWFWAEDPTERTSSHVEFIYGGDDTSPTRRTLFCIGQVGAKVAIYCVSSTDERDVTLILQAFLKGYVAAQNR